MNAADSVNLLWKNIVESNLPKVDTLANHPNFSVILGKYVQERKGAMLQGVISVVQKNGGIADLGKILTGFYQTGEYKQLFQVWLAATEPKYRREIMSVLACLLLEEQLIGEYMKRQAEARKR